MRQWAALAESPGVYLFFHDEAQRPIDRAAALLAAFVLTALLWPALLVFQRAVRMSPWRYIAGLFLGAMVCVAVNAARLTLSGNVFLYGLAAAAIAGVAALAIRPRALLRAAAAILLCLAPFAAWMSLRTVYFCVSRRTVYAAPRVRAGAPSRPAPRARSASRIVWVIFDEWDGAFTFDRETADRDFPALAAFRDTAVAAAAAQAPATETLVSVPALLTGLLLDNAVPAAGNDLSLRRSGAPAPVRFQQTPNLLRSLSDRGVAVGAAGWYLPYCRLFDGSLAACFSIPSDLNVRQGLGLFHLTAINLALALVPESSVRSLLGWMPDAGSHAVVNAALEPVARRMAADSSLDFVFLHLPIPHLPAIDRPEQEGLQRSDRFRGGYDDNLRLVDRTVARLRTAMEAAGVWDATTVLLSSDHWFRAGVHTPSQLFNRVPFLLKLKGQHASVLYQPRFNTVVTGALLDAVVNGDVESPGAAMAWLDAHRWVPTTETHK